MSVSPVPYPYPYPYPYPQMPEFVNPKYTDETKTKFKKPTRLETMMQDYPRELDEGKKSGFTAFTGMNIFSPVKNSVEGALGKVCSDSGYSTKINSIKYST